MTRGNAFKAVRFPRSNEPLFEPGCLLAVQGLLVVGNYTVEVVDFATAVPRPLNAAASGVGLFLAKEDQGATGQVIVGA